MRDEMAAKLCKTVPRDKAFYFFTSIGNYTGESAASLKEFIDKIDVVNVKSLEFHVYRGDFGKWISEVLQDENLALETGKLQRFSLSGDALRNQLRIIISRHLKSF